MKFLLSWSINDEGQHTYSFDWDFVKNLLINLENSYGSITLSLINKDSGITSLQLQAENHNYLITLEEETEDAVNIKSYFNIHNGQGLVEILGDYWDKRQVINDYKIVFDIFCQYYTKGDVIRDDII